MSKPIHVIIADTVKKSAKLFDKGVILEAPTRIDIMTAMIIDSVKSGLRSRNDEVTKYVLDFEDVCKYAKPVDDEVKAIYRSQF